MVRTILNTTNLATGTYRYIIETYNVVNHFFQYNLISGEENKISLKLFGTLDTDANDSSDSNWVDITKWVSSEDIIESENETVLDFCGIDTQGCFDRYMVKLIIENTNTLSNELKIFTSSRGFNY